MPSGGRYGWLEAVVYWGAEATWLVSVSPLYSPFHVDMDNLCRPYKDITCTVANERQDVWGTVVWWPAVFTTVSPPLTILLCFAARRGWVSMFWALPAAWSLGIKPRHCLGQPCG